MKSSKSSIKPIMANFSAVSEVAWYEYAIRFCLGGAVTVAAGLMAQKYGPAAGGLFLAFPAIFPSSATLIEKHERERKAQQRLHGFRRARQAVAADAMGAAMGSLGLIVFAIVVWQFVAGRSAVLVIGAATAAWVATSGLIWIAWKRNWLPHFGSQKSP